jgi:hypothetical protein
MRPTVDAYEHLTRMVDLALDIIVRAAKGETDAAPALDNLYFALKEINRLAAVLNNTAHHWVSVLDDDDDVWTRRPDGLWETDAPSWEHGPLTWNDLADLTSLRLIGRERLTEEPA